MAYSLAAQRTNAGQKLGTSSTTTCKENEEHRRIQLMPFGESTLSFLNVVVADTTRPIDLVKREGDRRYSIKINDQNMVTIEYKPDNAFTISVFNNSRWVTTLYIDAQQINIGNVAQAKASQVSALQVTQNEARNVYTTFKVENRSTTQLKRLDVKGHNTPWFSIFSHHTNLLMVRPNGNWVSEKMLYLTDQITTQAINNYRRSNGQGVLASNDTAVMQRRKWQEEKENFAQEANEMVEQKRQWQEEKEKFVQQANEMIEQKRQWLEEKEKFAQEASEMVEQKRKWQEEKEKCEQEMTILAERKRNLQIEKEKFENESKEVQQAKAELTKQQSEVQADKEKIEQAVAEVDSLQYELPPLVQSYPWSGRKFTTPTLNDRFTNRIRVVIKDGKMSVIQKSTRLTPDELD